MRGTKFGKAPKPSKALLAKLDAQEEQLTIIVDPFVSGSGAHVGFHYNGLGWSTEVDGVLTKRPKRSRRAF